MGMNERKYTGPFLRIETGEKGTKVDRCPCPENCPNDVGQNCCSMCGKPLDERYETFREPLPNPDDVLTETYGESLLEVLRLHRPGRYIIFVISNRAFNDDEETKEEEDDDGSVRVITSENIRLERSHFADEFSPEIEALLSAGAKVSVQWGEIVYWT